MSKKIGIPAVGITLLITVSMTGAADHSERGEYKTHALESELFVENGQVLGADLFFSKPGMDTLIAPRGSAVTQSVPPVVWQYAALLPVSDYLRTAAIHSVSTDEKIRTWQDVQSTFYSGLLAEGVTDMDAKIAYAGAYGFSPRWSLVEFRRISEKVPDFPNTELYSIDYIQPAVKGMTLESYRQLALQIFQRPEDFTLEDIMTFVDVADSKSEELSSARASLGEAVGANPVSNVRVTTEAVASDDSTPENINVPAPRVVIEISPVPVPVSASTGGVVGANGMSLLSGSTVVSRTDNDSLPAKSDNVVDNISTEEVTPTADRAKVAKEVVTTPGGFAISEFVDSAILSSGSTPAANSAGELAALEGPEDDWVTLPDGTMVLRNTARLVSE